MVVVCVLCLYVNLNYVSFLQSLVLRTSLLWCLHQDPLVLQQRSNCMQWLPRWKDALCGRTPCGRGRTSCGRGRTPCGRGRRPQWVQSAWTSLEPEWLNILCSRNLKMECKPKRRGAWWWKAILPAWLVCTHGGEYLISRKTLGHYYFLVFVPVLSRT